MSESVSNDAIAASSESKSLQEVALSGAIALAKTGENIEQANEQFEALLAQVKADGSNAAPLLKLLWKEYVSGQRSAAFWQVMSDAEKDLSDKMSATNIQLKQNYMRLIQEQ
ncbi:MAG: hypothetical protein AAFO84_01705 [Cyanobacteria bacterium J06598_1]